VASWYAAPQADRSDALQLVVLWRGRPAWWQQPGCIGGCGAGTDYVIEYGHVRLTLRYDAASSSVLVNGRTILLRGDNVLYVDTVDTAREPRITRTSHIDPRMPGTPGQIGPTLARSREVIDYLQCHARTGDAATDARLSTMCLTNLGRE
jgi:hypothetical protein